MLELALDKTKFKYGDYKLQASEKVMYQGDALNALAKGKYYDIAWSMTSQKREDDLHPIRIPLLKGLLGYRVFIIHKNAQKKFFKIKTIEEIKKLKTVQGSDWPDYDILKSAGFNIVGTTDYEHMFEMVNNGEIDYFPRGLNEPWEELAARPQLKNLIVDSKNVLVYPTAIYFFVNKNNKYLARRIQEGLDIAISDGSFHEKFFKHPVTKNMFKNSSLHKRNSFNIQNPVLPKLTPEDKKYWFYLKKR